MTDPACRTCRHFADDAKTIERAMPGLPTLGSAHAASRADDGYCAHHDRYVQPTARCPIFVPCR